MSGHSHRDNDQACHCKSTIASQSLDEMEFERGIWTAALYNDIDRLEKLISRGDVNRPDNFGYTALHYAARNNHYDACKILVQSGANVDAQTNNGVTALHRAAMMGHNDIVKLLLHRRANPLLRDNDGSSALHRAVQNSHLETAKILLDFCKDLKFIVNNKNQTPFDLTSPDDCTGLRSILQQ